MNDLKQAFQRFQSLTAAAEDWHARGRHGVSAALARLAALCAFPHHAGIFASPRLERLLLSLARTINNPEPASASRTSRSGRRVLHVLSHARPVGGDCRFAWRWMERDTGSSHSVAVTSQEQIAHLFEVPDQLRHAAESSGGTVHLLSAPPSRPLERASELRALCRQADYVILHLVQDDILPILALGHGCEGVKVAFVNHGDHCFSTGGSVSDLVVHHRRQSGEFLKSRRGLAPDQGLILPIPLSASLPDSDRQAARSSLGIAPDTVVLLTIASAFKYHPDSGEYGLLELVEPVVAASPNVMLLAAGPEPDGAWQEASARTGGRIRALGMQWNNAALYASADVYLDSVPFSSITSALEAGSFACPVVAFDRSDPQFAMLGLDAPGLEGTVQRASTPERYRAVLQELIDSPGERRRGGEVLRQRILDVHTGERWLEAVQNVYRRLDSHRPGKCLRGQEDAFAESLLDHALVRLYSQHPPLNLRRRIQECLGDLPYLHRVAALHSIRHRGVPPHPVNWLPENLYRSIRAAARSIRSIAKPPRNART